MIKLIENNEGKATVTEFESLEILKSDLPNYFTWILDNEPDKELPDFSDCENIDDINYILKDWDYSWWNLEVK